MGRSPHGNVVAFIWTLGEEAYVVVRRMGNTQHCKCRTFEKKDNPDKARSRASAGASHDVAIHLRLECTNNVGVGA